MWVTLKRAFPSDLSYRHSPLPCSRCDLFTDGFVEGHLRPGFFHAFETSSTLTGMNFFKFESYRHFASLSKEVALNSLGRHVRG